MSKSQRTMLDAVQEELRDLLLRVETAVVATRIWERVFTNENRRQLGGNLEEAYGNGGCVAIWRLLHGGSEYRAVIELALAVNLTDHTTANWLLRELGEPELGGDRRATQTVPFWDSEVCELRYLGQVIKHVKRPAAAKNVICVLAAFQEEGWPRRIDDPLPRGRDPGRLRKTVESLNNGFTGIIFHADGTGQGITWQAI